MSLIDGRPSTLLDRLTAARAAFLDAAITSRAAAATALSTATWTNARAAKLDYLDQSVSSAGLPVPTSLLGRIASNANLQTLDASGTVAPATIPTVTASETAFDTWKNVINITSTSGVVEFLNAWQEANSGSLNTQLRLTVDGTEVYLSDTNLWQTASTDDDKGLHLVGMSDKDVTTQHYVPGFLRFTDSLKLDFKKTESGATAVEIGAKILYFTT